MAHRGSWLALLGLVVGGLLFVGSAPLYGQGKYTPVTDEEVVALKLNHYFTPDKKAHDPDFEWSFTKTEFVLKKGKGAIPADLMEKLLPADATADEIRGKWKLESKEGQRLVLTEIKSGDKAGKKEASLVIYKTAPTVVRIGEVQYVFGIGR
jgi:hypothetical protein